MVSTVMPRFSRVSGYGKVMEEGLHQIGAKDDGTFFRSSARRPSVELCFEVWIIIEATVDRK